ncbi:hypothetical protein Pla175_48230 [Pirellulimonas nuda]|uniref:Uncharacterized protein n=1 Tax=Pirellulimonas nuda TaxID=2528009 RepID=A0A518DIU1_9BACT|nr:hypothetical protein [Pirellulimonas nuda]QDU91401.1 hypothetical protein Pla175_48230 [Pirellulimonas nuda]
MSLPDSTLASPRSVVPQKSPTTVYTVMLVLSLLAVIVGLVFLYLEWQRYAQ